MAEAAYGPVTEIDYHARLAWLQERRTPDLIAWLEGDPEHHDPKAAGWWLYVLACGIGNPFDKGPWQVVDGHLRKTGDGGQGVKHGLPHLGDAGKGINRELPHLGNAGKGINRELPHLGDAGKGINRELPHLGDVGEEVLAAYVRILADRLSRVRITCGNWRRVLTPSVIRSSIGGDRARAVFLDPPYATSGDLYGHRDGHATVAQEAREWAREATDLRIVLCGYDDEHDELLEYGWRRINGRSGRGSGYAVRSDNGRRERLWLNQQCLRPVEENTLFEASDLAGED
ncbi:MAG: hypothetical protein ACRDQA_05920 [Nocardioidaceae bacterium]